MGVISLLVILTVVSSARCQMMGMGMGMGMGQPGGSFMGMGSGPVVPGKYKPSFFDFGQAWDSFGSAFKEMSEQFKNMKPIPPWYKGDNICFREEFRHDPFGEEFFGRDGVEYENCREMGFKYVCIARIFVKGKSKERVRTYACCPGFNGIYNNGKKCV